MPLDRPLSSLGVEDFGPIESADRSRPKFRAVMRQVWRDLLFLHWEVPATVLRPHVPESLELDEHEGRVFVGLVPFTMRGVRPVGLPALPGLSAFPEVNVRTYVRLDGGDPGVWFLSLDARSRLVVWVARQFWNLPYHWASMSSDEGRERGGSITYKSNRIGSRPGEASIDLAYRPIGGVRKAIPGSLEHFLIERYVLYARGRGGRLWRGRVDHDPYPVQDAEVERLEETLLAANGLTRPTAAPLVHYSAGVRTRIGALRRLGGGGQG